MRESAVDIAIVGAGVAGTYAGWRLLAAPGADAARPSVRIFEGSHRVGGRLHSVVPEGMPNVRAEVGGMRIPTFHHLAIGCIAALGLPTRPFLGAGATEENLFYLRGRRLRIEDFDHPDRIPYNLRADEAGKTAAALLSGWLERLVPGGKSWSPEDWDRERPRLELDGANAFDRGLWSVLKSIASNEALSLVKDASGYHTSLGNWNALDLLSLFLGHRHGGHAELVTLVDGMMSLPTAMAQRFSEAGGVLSLGHRLHALHRGEDGQLELEVLSHHGAERVRARHVILAMPRRSLELMRGRSFLFEHRTFVEDLQTVIPQPASKLFLGFERPWWRDIGLRGGRSDTDLPMRQCYYFQTEGEQPGADPASQRSLLMAGYNDGGAVEYWSGYRGHAHLDSALFDPWLPAQTAEDLDAPGAMVKDALQQLSEVHGMAVPEPYTAFFKDWMEDPFGGAWHMWRVHARSWEVAKRMRRPVEGANVYVAGEAWSHEQGWVEGALSTAEAVLQEHLDMPPVPFAQAPAAVQ